MSDKRVDFEPFVVKHYISDERASIKGNGFDGLSVGEDREEAEHFISFVNNALRELQEARKDAARYRKWREYAMGDMDNYNFKLSKAWGEAETTEQWDAALDEFMAQLPSKCPE